MFYNTRQMLRINKYGWVWHDDINMIIPLTDDGEWLYKYFVAGFRFLEEKNIRVKRKIIKKLRVQSAFFNCLHKRYIKPKYRRLMCKYRFQ